MATDFLKILGTLSNATVTDGKLNIVLTGGAYPEVANWSALPTASTVSGQVYLVINPEGTWPFPSYKSSGLWYSNGTTWEKLNAKIFTFNDGNFAVFNNADNTKQLGFSVDNVSTSNKRIWTVGDRDLNFTFLDLYQDSTTNVTNLLCKEATPGQNQLKFQIRNADNDTDLVSHEFVEQFGNQYTIDSSGRIVLSATSDVRIQPTQNIRLDPDDGGAVFVNHGNDDVDYEMKKLGSGIAYKYDSGLNEHYYNDSMLQILNDKIEVLTSGTSMRLRTYNSETIVAQGRQSSNKTGLVVCELRGTSRSVTLLYGGTGASPIFSNNGRGGSLYVGAPITSDSGIAGIRLTDADVDLEIGSEDTSYIVMESENKGGNVGIHQQLPTSSFHTGGSVASALITKTADYTATGSDYTILLDTSSNDVTLTLPTAVGITGRIYNIKAIDLTNVADIATDGTETIDGVNGFTFGTVMESIKIQSDGSNWWIL